MKKMLNVKHAVIEDANFYDDQDGVCHLRIQARTDKWHQDDCPQGIWFSQHPKHARYGPSGMLGFEGSTS